MRSWDVPEPAVECGRCAVTGATIDERSSAATRRVALPAASSRPVSCPRDRDDRSRLDHRDRRVSDLVEDASAVQSDGRRGLGIGGRREHAADRVLLRESDDGSAAASSPSSGSSIDTARGSSADRSSTDLAAERRGSRGVTHPVEQLCRLAAILVAIVEVVTHVGSYPVLLVCAVVLCGLELHDARRRR